MSFDNEWKALKANMFNYEETKKINWVVKQVGELNHEMAKLRLEINNLKVELQKERRLKRENGM